MKLSREEVIKIAKLARLRLEEGQIEKEQEHLGSILGYVEQLQKLNTDDVPEFQHAAGGENVFREDVVHSCDENVRRRAIDNFSSREGDLLKVQAVFEGRTE